MSQFYVCKGLNAGSACLKIVNDRGVELSVAFDDSCGCLPTLSRVSMATFVLLTASGPKMEEQVGEEIYHVSAEDFLESLAKHLGYSVSKEAL